MSAQTQLLEMIQTGQAYAPDLIFPPVSYTHLTLPTICSV